MPKAAGAAGGTKVNRTVRRIVTWIAPNGRHYPAEVMAAGTGTTLTLRVRREPVASRTKTNTPKATTMAGVPTTGSYLDHR